MNKERYLNEQDRKDFLELITPFMERIILASEGKGRLTNKGQINEYKDIFDKYVRDPKSEELNIGCNNCMGLSYKQTIGKYERELKANGELPVFSMELIDDTDINMYLVDDAVSKFMTFPKQELVEAWDKVKDSDFNNLYIEGVFEEELIEQLEVPTDWRGFQQYCKSKGLKSGGKTRKQLEEELNNL